MPLHRRLPKFGFTNIFRQPVQIVNVADLARCNASEITAETLKAAGLIAKPEKASCTAKCHKAAEFKDVMLTQVHDKKPKK